MALVDVEVLSRVAPGHPAADRNDEEIMGAGTSTGRTVTANSKMGFGRASQRAGTAPRLRSSVARANQSVPPWAAVAVVTTASAAVALTCPQGPVACGPMPTPVDDRRTGGPAAFRRIRGDDTRGPSRIVGDALATAVSDWPAEVARQYGE
jgi:hypothetical protein